MNVLSLCDGLAGAYLALERAGFGVDNYFASEIDRYSIEVAVDNYPDIEQLGDIAGIDENILNDLPTIDLVIAGTPCKNLSCAVIDREEYHQGLEGEESGLFYEFARVLDWIKKNNNPNVNFLLENVESMPKEDRNIITKTLGVDYKMINSRLFSAQDRKRYYWTNINIPPLPSESELVLKDIMQSEEEVNKLHKNNRMDFWYEEDFEFHSKNKRQIATLDINGQEMMKRVYNPEFKSPTLIGVKGGNHQKKVFHNGKPRKLTPVEYERLQTVPDGYTEKVSFTRRYDMLGEGFTIDVIAHILKGMEE